MANYDGDIKLSMSLDPKDVKSASKELQDNIKDIFKDNAGKKLDSRFKSLQSSMNKASSTAQQLREKLKTLENTKIPTKEFDALQKEVDSTSAKLQSAKERMDKFLETGGDRKSRAFESMRYDIAQLEVKLEESQEKLQEMVDTGKAFKLGSDTAEYDETVEKLANVNNEMRVLTTKAEEATGGTKQLSNAFMFASKIFKEFANICGKVANALTTVAKKLWGIVSSGIKAGLNGIANAFKSIGNSANKAKGSTGSFFSNLLKYGLGITGLVTLFRKLRSAITEGMHNLVQFNGGANQANAAMSQLTSSLAYLKNAWAAAFAPVISYVAPVLARLVQMIATVVNAIGKLFAALSGKTSFTAAKYKQTDYAAGLGGGGGSKGKSAQEKYEEAKKKAQEKYEKQLAKTQEHNAKQVAKAEEKQAKAAKKLADAQEEVNEQLAHYDKLNVIAQDDMKDMEMEEFLPDLWEDPELEEINWEDFLDAGGAGDAFAEMFEEVPIDPWLLELAEKIKDIINQLITPIKKAWDEVKDYVIKSFKDMIKKIWSLIKTVFSDFLKMWNQEATVEMLKTIFEIFGDIFVIIGNIAEGLEEAWKKNDTGLHILENIRDIFKILVDHVKNVTESLKEWSKNLDFSPMLEAIERFTESLKKVADFIGGVFEDIMKNLVEPFFKYLLEDAGPRLLDAITTFNDTVDWNKLRENLNKVWEAVEKLLEGAFNDLAATLERLGPAVAEFLNSKEFEDFCNNVANFITRLGDSGLIEKIFGGLAIVIGDITDALVKFINSETFQNFINWLFDKLGDMTAEDVAKAIEKLAKAILIFKFGEFVGEGLAGILSFFGKLLLLAAVAGKLEVVGSVMTTIGTALSTMAGVIADVAAGFGALVDAWLLIEDLDLINFKHLQNSLPTTAKDTNGLAREVDGLGARILDFFGLLPEGVTLGDRMVAPSDYEKLEGMVSRLGTMEQELENTGNLSDEVSGKIDQAWSVLGDNFENVENLTDDQVRAFGNLYKSVEDYYNKCAENDAAVEALGIVRAEWEKIPEALPDEEDGKKGIEPFAKGVVSGVNTTLQNDQSIKEGGKYLTQGIKQGVDEGLEEDPPGNWFEGILTGFAEFFQIGSPSLVMAEQGQYLIEGLQMGIENIWPMFMDYIKTSLDELMKKFRDTWDEILKNASEAWTKIKTDITTKFTELKNKMKEIGDLMKENLSDLNSRVGELFDKMKSKISSVADSIKSTLRNLVDAVKNAVEQIKSALSSIGSMVSSAASSVMGRVGSIASSIRVPHLAQGAVIPPNHEFMAVLGDQKKGMNVETPLSTMVEAFNQALDARGGASEHEPIVLQLDSEVLAQAVWDEEEKRYKQNGDYQPLFGY